MGETSKEARFAFNFIQDLFAISEELAELYNDVCMVNGEKPCRIMLDHVKDSGIVGSTSTKSESPESDEDQTYSLVFNVNASKLDNLKEKLKSGIAIKILLEDDKKEIRSELVIPSKRLLDTIRDQLSHLTKAVKNSIEICRRNNIHTGNQEHLSLAEIEDLQEQVIKLKSLLYTKREQMATLRAILKVNKQTAEVAMAYLKSRYENEKAIVSETMSKLRKELKALKEDAATFALLRASYEETVNRLDDLQRQLLASDEQKRKLSSLLRLAIQQKLDAMLKVEEYEMENIKGHGRRHGFRNRNAISRGSFSSGSQSGSSAFGGGRHGRDNYPSRRDC